MCGKRSNSDASARVLGKGRREKKRTKVTYIRCSAKKKQSLTLFYFYFYFYFSSILFNAFFWAFHNKGSSKTRKNFFSKKIHLGSSQKNVAFLPRLFGSIFVYRVFGRFVTRGVQKCDKQNRAKISSAPKKSTHSLTSLFFLFFSRRPRGRQTKNRRTPPYSC
jgi:hypothetical protein